MSRRKRGLIVTIALEVALGAAYVAAVLWAVTWSNLAVGAVVLGTLAAIAVMRLFLAGRRLSSQPSDKG